MSFIVLEKWTNYFLTNISTFGKRNFLGNLLPCLLKKKQEMANLEFCINHENVSINWGTILGSGAEASVYLGNFLKFLSILFIYLGELSLENEKRTVAIKVARTAVETNIEKEAKFAWSMDHPNISKIFGVCMKPPEGKPFSVISMFPKIIFFLNL